MDDIKGRANDNKWCQRELNGGLNLNREEQRIRRRKPDEMCTN